jgi:hypothetical protein
MLEQKAFKIENFRCVGLAVLKNSKDHGSLSRATGGEAPWFLKISGP